MLAAFLPRREALAISALTVEARDPLSKFYLDTESKVRLFERSAAVFVAVITTLAFLAFPILGLWYITNVWPCMSKIDKGLFSVSLIILGLGIPYCFRSGLKRMRRGRFSGMRPIELVLVGVPVILGGWVLTHQVYTLIFMLCWNICEIYRAAKTQPEASSISIKTEIP